MAIKKSKKGGSVSELGTVTCYADKQGYLDYVKVQTESGRSLKFTEDKVPEYIMDGKFLIRMNGECSELMGLVPVSASMPVKFGGFVVNNDNIPIVIEGDDQYGHKIGALANLVVLGGKFRDFVFAHYMPYAFQIEDGELRIGGRGVKKMMEFLEAFGLDTDTDSLEPGDPMMVLRNLEELLFSKKVSYLVDTNNKGWVDNFHPFPAGISAKKYIAMLEEDDEEEEEEHVEDDDLELDEEVKAIYTEEEDEIEFTEEEPEPRAVGKGRFKTRVPRS